MTWFFDPKLLTSTDLGGLYTKCKTHKSLKSLLKFEFESSEFNIYNEEAKSHEAGYDAYMTGVVFATLMKYWEIGKFIEENTEKPKKREKKGKEKIKEGASDPQP